MVPIPMMSVIYFLLLVGALVAVHELGHFMMAKFLGIRVQELSMGFGKPLWRKQFGHTSYQIGRIPLGGYVRLFGDTNDLRIPKRLQAVAFGHRPLWQKLLVLIGGPAANLLLPFVIYFPMFLGQSVLPAAVVGDVLVDTPASRAGLAPGDQILSIDGHPVTYWKELEKRIEDSSQKALTIEIKRGTKQITRYVRPLHRLRDDGDGLAKKQNFVGIVREPLLPRVGLLDSNSPVAKAGLDTGDVLLAVNGRFIASTSDVEKRLRSARRATISYARIAQTPIPGLVILDPNTANLVIPKKPAQRGFEKTDKQGGEKLHGLDSSDLVVAYVEKNARAWQAGIRPGDAIFALEDRTVYSWIQLNHELRRSSKSRPRIFWKRKNERGVIEEHSGILPASENSGRFGATQDRTRGDPTLIPVDGRIRHAVAGTVGRSMETIQIISEAIWSIARGQDPNTEFGGPVALFHAASESGKQGWEAFLVLMALISVSVGLINLLPIPVLDGGQILINLVETSTGKSLSPLIRSRLTLLGLAIVGWLTVVALKNDIVRYFL